MNKRSMVVDTHAHLNDERFAGEIEETIQRAYQAGVEYIINVGYDLPSSRMAVALARDFPGVYAAVGIHPHDAKTANEEAYREIRELAKDDKVVAIGEIGLDYHYDLSPRPIQMEVFLEELKIAKELDLPVIIHDREAHGHVMNVLKSQKGLTGVLHSFSGSYEMAKDCIELGYYISFGGPVTFNNARRIREVVAKVPIDKILVETDCPYLTPEPHRGKRNEPRNVIYVVEKIAQIKGLTYETVAEKTRANSKALFGLS